MAKRSARKALGFTLIELLTVVAIISLLIAILVPALSRSRTQTHRARTAAKLRCLDISLAMFHDDWNRFPVSSRHNPFEHLITPGPPEMLHVQGAQALFMELVGVDCCGYVEPHVSNDTNDDHRIDWQDWLAWYSADPTVEYPRFGPYLELEPGGYATPRLYLQDHPGVSRPAPNVLGYEDGGIGGYSVWNNGRLPFFLDSFGFPILYYRAKPPAKHPVATGTTCCLPPTYVPGVFDQSDNAGITGFTVPTGRQCYAIPFNGWDFADLGYASDQFVHPISTLGYHPSMPDQWPPRRTFAWSVCNRMLFDGYSGGADDGGKLTPYRKDTYILIAPGEDGRYGTGDDIHNFQRQTP